MRNPRSNDFEYEGIVDRLGTFILDEQYSKEINSIIDTYPENKSWYLKYADINKFDIELAYYLEEQPHEFIKAAEEAILRAFQPEAGVKIFVRPIQLPESKLSVSSIRAVDVGRLVRLEGRIRKAKGTKQKIQVAAFTCARCGNLERRVQDTFDLTEPLECKRTDEGGCGRGDKAGHTKWYLLDSVSEFRDYQFVYLEEHFDLAMQHQPETIRCIFWDDITGMGPVNDVVINGIVTTKMLKIQKTAVPETYVHVLSVELPEDLRDATKLTEEEIAEIKELAEHPDIYSHLVQSMAPHIKGEDRVKEAVIVALFGGVRKVLPDSTKIRGNSHVLIAGDPSKAKSKILKYASECAPMSMLTDGAGTSGAGLTFAVTKDDVDKQWCIDMGVIPMCNGGIAIIDEIDKMSKEDTDRMHAAMEDEVLHYAKAGLVGSLQAKTAIIAGGNPKHGRFLQGEPIPQQIDLSPALISRFDLIFALEDKPDPKMDKMIAEYVIETHSKWNMDLPDEHVPRILPVMIRKMVAYARQNINPSLSETAGTRLVSHYTDLRRKNMNVEGMENTIPVTLRQLEGAVRLSEAYARIRHSYTVEVKDVERTIRLIESSLYGFSWNEGVFDIDMMEADTSAAQRFKFQAIRNAILDYDQFGKGAGQQRLNEDGTLRKLGITGLDLDRLLESMKDKREIFETKPGFWKLIGP